MSDISDEGLVDMAEYRRRLERIMKRAENDPEIAKHRDMITNGNGPAD